VGQVVAAVGLAEQVGDQNVFTLAGVTDCFASHKAPSFETQSLF